MRILTSRLKIKFDTYSPERTSKFGNNCNIVEHVHTMRILTENATEYPILDAIGKTMKDTLTS